MYILYSGLSSGFNYLSHSKNIDWLIDWLIDWCALLKKASILPESSAVKKQPQDWRAYNKRETISAWKTVLRCLTGRPWSRNLFNKKYALATDRQNTHMQISAICPLDLTAALCFGNRRPRAALAIASSQFGLRGVVLLTWFASYLSDRRFQVFYGGSCHRSSVVFICLLGSARVRHAITRALHCGTANLQADAIAYTPARCEFSCICWRFLAPPIGQIGTKSIVCYPTMNPCL